MPVVRPVVHRVAGAPRLHRVASAVLVMVVVLVGPVGCSTDNEGSRDTARSADALGNSPGGTGSSIPAQPATAPSTASTLAPTTTLAPLPEPFESIAARTRMTAAARALLAAADVELVDAATLADRCDLDPEMSVLGCHRTDEITVLRVTDPRLDGMMETTTAHEMLHAAWERLDRGERSRLSALLQTAYGRVGTPELIERIDAYRARDAKVVDNELHSILGTEVADLGPDLETYYRRWFDDRSAVVALNATSRAALNDIDQQVDRLDAQLASERRAVESGNATIERSREQLDASAANIESLRTTADAATYNSAVDRHNQLVDGYNELVQRQKDLVARFNELVDQRNTLAADYMNLAAQIDTTIQTAPTA